ncbi:MAG: hypothetical protein M3132_07750 [Actinomycetia bacterium]|nr:hypothetical protein [Actinomycetes bacterium]
MTPSLESPNTAASSNVQRFATASLVLAALVVASVFIQSVLAGQHLAFGSSIEIHGLIGSAVFTFQAALVVLVFMGRASTEVKITAILILGLLFAQIGLGYATRSGGHVLNAWHIPLGITLFGMSTWQLARIRS